MNWVALLYQQNQTTKNELDNLDNFITNICHKKQSWLKGSRGVKQAIAEVLIAEYTNECYNDMNATIIILSFGHSTPQHLGC